ncbi:MAG: tetratricopeptide repeat protein [Rhodothermales bacterium]
MVLDLGLAYLYRRDLERAITHFETALNLDAPSLQLDILYSLACCHALKSDKEEALTWLKKAVDAGMTDWAEMQQDTDLDAVKDTDAFKVLIGRMQAVSH